MAEAGTALTHSMERNLRLLNWWWWLRRFWLGEAIWVVYLTQEHGLTIGQTLMFEATYAAAVLIGEVPSGILADRFGHRRTLLAAGLILMLGLATFGLGEGLVLLLIGYAAFGLADAAFSGSDSAILFGTLRPLGLTNQFEPKLGRLHASGLAGIAAMTVGGAVMVQWTPISTPILLSMVLTVPSLFLVLKMREPPRSGEQSNVRSIGSGALKRILTTRSMWSVVLLSAVTRQSIVLITIVQQPILLELGFPIWSLGVFVAIQLLIGAGASWVAGPVAERIGLRLVFLVMPLVSAFSLLAGASDWPGMYVFFMVPALGFPILSPQSTGFLSRRVGDDERATVISMASMVASTMAVVGTSLIGLLVDRASLDAALTATSLLLSILGLLAYLAWATSGDTERDPPDAPPHAEAVPAVEAMPSDWVPSFVFPRGHP